MKFAALRFHRLRSGIDGLEGEKNGVSCLRSEPEERGMVPHPPHASVQRVKLDIGL